MLRNTLRTAAIVSLGAGYFIAPARAAGDPCANGCVTFYAAPGAKATIVDAEVRDADLRLRAFVASNAFTALPKVGRAHTLAALAALDKANEDVDGIADALGGS